VGRGRPLRRVVVTGPSGAGKSTLGRRLAGRLDVAYVELDALFHGADWTPNERFVEDVAAATETGGWVVDGGYSAVRDLLWQRADTVIWLDLPRTTTLRRVLLRTAGRLATRQELWNGNRERWSTVLRASHPIRWTWSTQPAKRADMERRTGDPAWAHLQVVRLRTPAEVRRWEARL
jgi:adenylate kinase family enzyme